jgi:hypothetical protein
MQHVKQQKAYQAQPLTIIFFYKYTKRRTTANRNSHNSHCCGKVNKQRTLQKKKYCLLHTKAGNPKYQHTKVKNRVVL